MKIKEDMDKLEFIDGPDRGFFILEIPFIIAGLLACFSSIMNEVVQGIFHMLIAFVTGCLFFLIGLAFISYVNKTIIWKNKTSITRCWGFIMPFKFTEELCSNISHISMKAQKIPSKNSDSSDVIVYPVNLESSEKEKFLIL